MRNRFLNILMLIACLFMSSSIYAFDFAVNGICYNVLSDANNTCEVTWGGETEVSGTESYKGNMTIPTTVHHTDKTYNVVSIGEYAFMNCKELLSVSLPRSVTSLGEEAFRGCTSLRTIKIPDTVTDIWYDCFRGCSSLASIKLPKNMTEINEGVFYDCSNLSSVVVPKNVTIIGERAFAGCTNLKKVIIPKAVNYIGMSAFRCCPKLTSVKLHHQKITICEDAFDDNIVIKYKSKYR